MKDTINYKMEVNPAQSRAVQEACFEHGIYWNWGGKRVTELDKPYLYIVEDRIYFWRKSETFNSSRRRLITPEEFIAMLNGKLNLIHTRTLR